MRVFTGILGSVFGVVIGVVLALFAAVMLARNEPFGVIFIAMLMVPVGLVFGGIIGALAGLQVLPRLRDQQGGQLRPKKALMTLGVVLSGTITLIGVLAWTLRMGTTPPSDQKLLSNFHRHEATFNQLIEMLKTDGDLIRVDEDWTNPEHPETIGVSPARVTEYRQLLRQARVPRGFQSEPFMYEVDFFYWTIGSAISSDLTKGYAYRKSPPIETLSSLDGFRPEPRNADETIKVYKHIHGNWYLFCWYIPG
jgi:hypothetical protein